MRRILRAACILSALAAGTAAADTTVDETHPAAEHGLVSIRNLSGSVHVTGWDKKDVRVEGTLGRAVKRLVFERDGERTRIEVELPENVRLRDYDGDHRAVEGRLEVSVPAGSAVRVEGVNIGINVDGVNGELELRTVNGGVGVNGRPDEIKVSTVNGAIDVNSDSETTHLETVNGTIDVAGGKGELEAACVNGRINVRDGTFEEASCTTVSGDVTWTANLAARGSLNLETHSGSIELALPRSTSAEFNVTTFSGKIENELGPAAQKTGRYGPGYSLEFDLGSGASKIDISSFSGHVTIRGK